MADDEKLEEVHAEAIKPKSIEELARSIDLSQRRKFIAVNNDRRVLVEVLKINGITHETLNISKSKFAKLNKAQLVDALFDSAKKEQEQEQEQSKQESAESGADYLNKLLELKEVIAEAQQTKDYKKLDSVVAMNLLEAISSDDKLSEINIKSPHFTKILLAVGSIYFIARLYGFEKIGKKFGEILKKTKGKNGTHEDN